MRPQDNPFRSTAIEKLSFAFRGDWSLDRVIFEFKRNYSGAIVGPRGSGKTTLLLELESKLRQENFPTELLFFNRECKKLNGNFLQNTAHKIILVDGFEHLSFMNRMKFKSLKRRGLLIAAHRSFGLPVLYRTKTDLALLCQLTRTLSEVSVSKAVLEALFFRHSGNVRACFLDLYRMLSEEQFNLQADAPFLQYQSHLEIL